MKLFSLGFAVLFPLITPSFGAPPETAAEAEPEYAAGEVLVKFKPNTTYRAQEETLFSHGGLQMNDPEGNAPAEVLLLDDDDVHSAVRHYRNHPDVEYAQPNYVYHMTKVPNDPYFSMEWALKNTSQTIDDANLPASRPTQYPLSSTGNPGSSGSDLGLERAWDTITDCSQAIIAVVDSGVNYNHADLADNMWNGGSSYPNHGYNYVNGNNDPMDKNGHGTHVAGIIAAVGNNGTGVAGVCWKAKIMALRALDSLGSGYTSWIAQAINFAANNGAKVINLSLGGSSYDAALAAAVSNAESRGAVVVAAAGNDGSNNDSSPVYPCNLSNSNLICVAALDQRYALASFSNYGKSTVDIGAPGVNILSSWPGSETIITPTFSSGWTSSTTTTNVWGSVTMTYNGDDQLTAVGAGGQSTGLAVPSNYDRNLNKYDNSTDARIYQTFNLASNSPDTAKLQYSVILDVQASNDVFQSGCIASSGSALDPFGTGGTLIAEESTSTSGYRRSRTYDISSCISSNGSIGFRLKSDSSTNSYGAAVSKMQITTLKLGDTNVYNVIRGTSMATPFVSGIAAMVMSFNPSYSLQEAVQAILAGGTPASSLSGITRTGNAANAMGAISYIQTPTGVTAQARSD